jgi:predicted N-acetyltransferase YhbS
MTKDTVLIRLETARDHREVENVTREAFWNHHVPGCDEHYLAHVLRNSTCFLPELDFVAESGGSIIGNIMYTRATIFGDDEREYPVLSFGPLSVLPDWQGKGVGSALVRHSLAEAKKRGHAAVLIYGDPAFYGRLGFTPAERFGICTADEFYLDALQAVELIPGALNGKAGRFCEDPAYHIDEQEAEDFDAEFPEKERVSGLPSQQRFLQQIEMRRPRK